MAWHSVFKRNPRLEQAYAGLTGGRRLWPMQVALISGIAIAVVPLLLVAGAALLVGVIVYAVCSVIEKIRQLFTPGSTPAPTPDEAVRENVRVVRR